MYRIILPYYKHYSTIYSCPNARYWNENIVRPTLRKMFTFQIINNISTSFFLPTCWIFPKLKNAIQFIKLEVHHRYSYVYSFKKKKKKVKRGNKKKNIFFFLQSHYEGEKVMFNHIKLFSLPPTPFPRREVSPPLKVRFQLISARRVIRVTTLLAVLFFLSEMFNHRGQSFLKAFWTAKRVKDVAPRKEVW